MKQTDRPQNAVEWNINKLIQDQKDIKSINDLEKLGASMTKPILKPCPFCGHTALSMITALNGLHMWIECAVCYARGPKKVNTPDVIKEWNTRPQLTGSRDKLAKIIYGKTNYLTGDLMACAVIADAIISSMPDWVVEDK